MNDGSANDNYPFANNAEAKAYCESFYMDMNNRPDGPTDRLPTRSALRVRDDNGQEGVATALGHQ